jgi:hypothetical protein
MELLTSTSAEHFQHSAEFPTLCNRGLGPFSALKRLRDVLRPDRPAASGEPPRPPMPIGTASPE